MIPAVVAMRCAIRGLALGLVLLPPSSGVVQAAEPPFQIVPLRVPGRPTQVWTVPLSPDCRPGARDLLVISLEGGPPDQRRHVTIFPCDPAGARSPATPLELAVDGDVVALDVYELDGAPGGEIVLLARPGLRVISPFGPSPARTLPITPPLPLPPPARGLSRMPVVGDWNGSGRPVAMLPTMDGAILVDLQSGNTRPLPLPLIADYETFDPDMPGRIRKLMIATTQWPVLMQGDDDGDGRSDLFALSRWNIWVFRADEGGLPSQPSRRLELRPFGSEEEVHFQTTDVTYYAQDLDGDGLADLLLHKISGNAMTAHAVTEIFLNPGTGAVPAGPPDAKLEVSRGFSGVQPMDLDGDGRSEIVQSSNEMGIVSLVRVLLTRKIDMKLRVLNAAPTAPGGFVTSWEQDVTFKLDLGEGRIAGFFPTGDGDWNADGRRDLLHPSGDDAMAIRLGEPGALGPTFGKPVGEQPMPLSAGRLRVADLDGDGLDDLVAYDPYDTKGRVFVFYNRGILPGTKPGS